ncbi:hypothetical protein J2S00_002056 [Caldalkalibacillus uzonensis]|uniref:YvrJ family protein n=1 Tax=Caldalkalibacillus uzonensis TaxID=353224 RepID=A0ABU0CSE0_9BACI|nr:YvrJ family protein [Caldalkalibacillus uzonensis]MDQ0339269.1 hypothetical protein [Caldalkalibacillus uzonensis]
MTALSEWSAVVQLLANVGFPAAVAMYLLFRFEKRIGNLERALADNIKDREKQGPVVQYIICARENRPDKGTRLLLKRKKHN